MKNVLLIGDSIRKGYCNMVRDDLADVANVYFPEENCRFTQYTYVSLLSYLKLIENPEDIDVIHWNNGQWDLVHWDGDVSTLNTAEQYGDMLRRIYHRMREKAPNAKIIFATTTPMNPSGLQCHNIRYPEDIIKFNDVAKAIMMEYDVEINDLYELMKDKPATFYKDHCHLTPEGYRLLADRVSAVIRKAF
jgi:lysophospholipase L1-like esterase